MDPEEKLMLSEIKSQVAENNVMMKKILKQNQIALWSKFAYWGFIILLTVGAFAIIKPILGTLGSIYSPSSFGDTGNIEKFRAELEGL